MLGNEMKNSAHNLTVAPVENLFWVAHGDHMRLPSFLFGDPEQIGDFYVMRYRILAACDVPPHWHPEDEHATVIAGEISLGLGEKFVGESLRSLKAGSYALIPRNQPHFTRYSAGTIVQVHGVGPLVINYVER